MFSNDEYVLLPIKEKLTTLYPLLILSWIKCWTNDVFSDHCYVIEMLNAVQETLDEYLVKNK